MPPITPAAIGAAAAPAAGSAGAEVATTAPVSVSAVTAAASVVLKVMASSPLDLGGPDCPSDREIRLPEVRSVAVRPRTGLHGGVAAA